MIADARRPQERLKTECIRRPKNVKKWIVVWNVLQAAIQRRQPQQRRRQQHQQLQRLQQQTRQWWRWTVCIVTSLRRASLCENLTREWKSWLVTSACCPMTSGRCCVPSTPYFTRTMTAQDLPRRAVDTDSPSEIRRKLSPSCLELNRRHQDLPRRPWRRRKAARQAAFCRSTWSCDFVGHHTTTRPGARVHRRRFRRRPLPPPNLASACLAVAVLRAAKASWLTRLTPRPVPANRHMYSPRAAGHSLGLDENGSPGW